MTDDGQCEKDPAALSLGSCKKPLGENVDKCQGDLVPEYWTEEMKSNVSRSVGIHFEQHDVSTLHRIEKRKKKLPLVRVHYIGKSIGQAQSKDRIETLGQPADGPTDTWMVDSLGITHK